MDLKQKENEYSDTSENYIINQNKENEEEKNIKLISEDVILSKKNKNKEIFLYPTNKIKKRAQSQSILFAENQERKDKMREELIEKYNKSIF